LAHLAVLKHLGLVDFDLRSVDGLVELTHVGGRVYNSLCNEGVYSENPDSNKYTELPTNCVTFFREALSIPSRFLVT